MKYPAISVLLVVAAAWSAVGCGSESSSTTPADGAAGTVGSAAGGTPAANIGGSATGSGGLDSAAGGTGGLPEATGGVGGVMDPSSAGGAMPVGATGGGVATGGSVATGGTVAVGGSVAAGGTADAAGGSAAGGASSGGTAPASGGTDTGGSSAAGGDAGSSGVGGSVATGGTGATGSGGTGTGGASTIPSGPVLRVDFDMSGRPEGEVNELGYTPWPVETATSITITLDDVGILLRTVGAGTALTSSWYKAGVQAPYYARLVNDGVTVEDGTAGAEIEMVLSGLPAGTHTLLVYHNNVDNPETNTFAPVDILVDGNLVVDGLVPSARALANVDAEFSYFEFEAQSGQDVVVSFRADPSAGASNANVILNGFELNTPNAALQATNPVPAHGDEHVDADTGSLTLSWTAATTGVSHDVYFGTDLAALEAADTSSPLFMGNQTATTACGWGQEPRSMGWACKGAITASSTTAPSAGPSMRRSAHVPARTSRCSGRCSRRR